VLGGSVDLDASTFRFQAQLTRRSDDAVLWAQSYTGDLEVSRILEIEEDIARQVATALAQPYGVIFQADALRHRESPPDDWGAYSCTLSYYAYRATLDSVTHPKVRRCLEEAVGRFPRLRDGVGAAVPDLYRRDAVRLRRGPGCRACLRRPCARRRPTRVELDPTNTRGQQAKMFALYFSERWRRPCGSERAP
jgi:hypothetical protein